MSDPLESVEHLSPEQRAALFRRLNARRRAAAADARIVPVARDGASLPLSLSQQRFWFLQQLAPESGFYNSRLVVRLTGTLDVDALGAALTEIVRRHEALRTSFRLEGGEPRQFVCEARPMAMPLADLRSLPEGDREAEARRLVEADVHRPFDLAAGPPFRARLVRLGDAEHVAVFVMHHLLTDLWSMEIFVRELGVLYDARRRGALPVLPELPLQYGDYAQWQRGWLAGEGMQKQLAYWRERLAQPVAALELPADHPRPAFPTFRGCHVRFRIGKPVLAAAQDLARRENATLFMVLLAAWSTLLSRLSGMNDVVVGSPVAGRSRREVESLIGVFINTVALRTDLSGDASFREVLRRTRETCVGAFGHQDVPFERIVEELQPQRDPSRSPFFDVMFVLQSAAEASFEVAGLTGTVMHVEDETSKFDLILALGEEAEGLSGMLEYSRDLFTPASVERFAGAFRTLLGSMLTAPDRRLSTFPLAEGTARVGKPARALPVMPSLTRRFEAVAERFGDRVAATSGGLTLTYRELNAHANALARDLIARGVQPEVRVGLEMERGVDMIVAILAVLKAGGAYVPIDPQYPEERRRYIADDAGVAFTLTSAGASSRDGSNLPLEVDPDHAAYVIYTSGSTGTPKGCVVTHANVASLLEATDERFDFDEDDVWSLFHSFAFDFSVWELWGPLLHGARLVIVPHDVTREPDAFADLLVREGVTVLSQTPSAFRALLDRVSSGHALRYVIFGGEALDPRMLQPWMARFGDDAPRLVNMYGITETTVHVTFREITADARGGVIGEALASHEIALVDAHLQPVLQGVPGEVLVGGPCVARGYLDRPDLTALRFIPDPFGDRPGARLYRSGDRARLRNDGELEFLGRIDRQVKVRGFRIEVSEVEAALTALSEVSQAVVVVRDDSLVAYLVAASSIDAQALRAALARTLPEHMIPASFVALDRIPLTAHGKLDLEALPESGSIAIATGEPPRTPSEVALASIWCELLGVQSIARDADFFAAGGHSLLAVRMVERVRAAHGVSLPIAAVFTTPRLSQLAELMDARDSLARPLVVPLSPGSGDPLVLIHGGGGSVGAYAQLAQRLDRWVLGVQALGFDDDAEPQTTIEAMAATYLRQLPPKHVLGGWSLGGTIAFEMARQSHAARVVLIDAPPPGLRQVLPAHIAIPPDIDARSVARWRALLTAQLEALARYEPAPFDGEVVLLRAQEGTVDLQWSRFAPSLRVIDVPGDHHSMLRTLHVDGLARMLREVL